jgi:hypothetical protein
MKGYYKDLELGEYYSIQVRMKTGFLIVSDKLRFIRVTPKGFNFLDEGTSKCIFPHHFYKSNRVKKFYINSQIIIKKVAQ